MKVTPARRKALLWFSENDGAKFYPIGISRRIIAALVSDGLLREDRPQFGFVRHFITDLGRAVFTGGERPDPER